MRHIKASTLRAIIDYVMITIGSFILSLGIGLFLIDAYIVPGGVTGLSMAINYVFPFISVGKLIFILNIPLFIWGILELGKQFGIRTFYGFVTNSFFIDLIRGDVPGLSFIRWQDWESIQYMLENEFFFSVCIGGILGGIGLGVVFKFGGTTAGTEIVSAILKKRIGMKPGVSFLIVDSIVILIAGGVIHYMGVSSKPTLVLIFYAVLALYFSSVIVDKIIYGFDYAKNVMIISDKNREISSYILNDMERGVTALYARGLFSNQEREVLMTVLSPNEVRTLTPVIKDIEPNSFIILSNVHEVVGDGFRRREELELAILKNAQQRELEFQSKKGVEGG